MKKVFKITAITLILLLLMGLCAYAGGQMQNV